MQHNGITFGFSKISKYWYTKPSPVHKAAGTDRVKGTSNYLPEFQNPLNLTLSYYLNFLDDIRGILPEIDIGLPCSSPPPPWSVTNMAELNQLTNIY